jgi:hypothetical protein
MEWRPVYCANCGVDGGVVPVTTTAVCYLCDKCFETHGVPLGTMVTSDEVFWAKVHREMIDQYGRQLTAAELDTVKTANCSPLAALIREGARLNRS